MFQKFYESWISLLWHKQEEGLEGGTISYSILRWKLWNGLLQGWYLMTRVVRFTGKKFYILHDCLSLKKQILRKMKNFHFSSIWVSAVGDVTWEWELLLNLIWVIFFWDFLEIFSLDNICLCETRKLRWELRL